MTKRPEFDCRLDYGAIDFRERPDPYRVGKAEWFRQIHD